MKRAKKLFFQRLSETDFSGESVTKISSDISAVHPLWSGRQPQQDLWGEIFKYGPVAVRCSMMSLVNHDVIVESFSQLFPKLPIVQHSHRAEKMLQPMGLKWAHL